MSTRFAPTHLLLLPLLLAACGSGSGNVGAFSAGLPQGEDGGSESVAGNDDVGDGDGDDDDGDGTGSSDDGSGDEGGFKFDVVEPDEGNADGNAEGNGTGEACKNVDLLFIVDDSSSMYDQQVSLIESFPGFVAGIQATLATVDSYHIGVISSDAYEGNELGCRDLGDLITRTEGYKSSQDTCSPFSSGLRFMDETQPDMDEKFACAANPGILGEDDERVMRSVLDAVSPAKNGPGACNEGFLREDALLVVVIITDEDDKPNANGNGSGGTPQEWYDELVGYKSGFAENVAVLSLVGLPDSSCDAVIGSNLSEFTDLFGSHGFVGDVCLGDYTDFFTDALTIVDTACSDFVPVG